jgi:hypothetical protein
MASPWRLAKQRAYHSAIGRVLALVPVLLFIAQICPTSTAAQTAGDRQTHERKWGIVGEAANDADLSGAACAPDGRCLLVSDEKRRAWFFVRDEKDPAKPTIIVGDPVKLTPATGDHEADAEGAAFDQGRFYVIGSHGTSRRKGAREASRYSTYRVEADGKARASERLAAILAGVPGIREHFCSGTQPERCESLQEGGANIEGLAARDGRLYVGFRAPAPGGKAFVVRVAEGAVFGDGNPDLRTFRLELGQDGKGRDLGVRDIAAVSDGFLVLAGPSLPEGDDAVGSGKILHWREGDERPRPVLDVFVAQAGVKPEILLVLGEDQTGYRVLVMCDGVFGGSPTEYRIRKQ